MIASGKDVRESDFDALTNNMSSGQYFTSYAYFQGILEPNNYTLILSAQDESIVREKSRSILGTQLFTRS